ncbi:MAG: hypothetical protein H7Y07_09890 [Pyrinomonadaceae bacterium]|nr:hypothetical protein [Sphingobacteriaceae bacterium]
MKFFFLFLLFVPVSLISCNSGTTQDSSSTDSLKKDSSKRSITLNDDALLVISKDSSKLDSAIMLTEKALQLDFNNLIAHINRLSWLCKAQKYPEAFTEIEILDKMEPNNSETIFLHGLLAEKLSNIGLARVKYKEAFLLNDKRFKEMDSDDKMFQLARANWAINLYFLDEMSGKKEFNKINSEYPGNKTAADFLSLNRNKLLTEVIQNR